MTVTPNNNAYVTAGLEPAPIFRHFEELTRIPRGSGNESVVSDFIRDFAKGLGMDVHQDAAKNLVIRKGAGISHTASPAILLQGHLDMVNEKTPESGHDFLKDPLDIYIDGDWLQARGTTLGGDNGIAAAMMMALMEGDYDLPALEFVLTTEEETGMDGATALDPSLLTGRALINIDNEDEGVFLSSCAGGLRARFSLPIDCEPAPAGWAAFTLTIGGMKGGHSGTDIDKERGNAVRLLARALDDLSLRFGAAVAEINGGAQDNAIPRDASALVYIAEGNAAGAAEAVKGLEVIFRHEYRVPEPRLSLSIAPGTAGSAVMTRESVRRAISALLLLPNGIEHMSMDIIGLVESSNNVGIVRTENGYLNAISTIRSSVVSRKREILERMNALAALTGATVTTRGDFPAWEYAENSRLRDVFCETYRRQTGKEPVIAAIHAGVECGLLAGKLPGVDMIAFGPEMEDVHTPDERLSISSTARTWALLLEVLTQYYS